MTYWEFLLHFTYLQTGAETAHFAAGGCLNRIKNWLRSTTAMSH